MVKRAVGTKACLLGKAVTCNYLRKDNFLEVLQSTVVSCLWKSKHNKISCFRRHCLHDERCLVPSL